MALGSTFTDVASLVRDVGQDPCLLEVARQAGRLHDAVSTPSTPGGPPSPPIRGIGLCGVVRPLRAVTYLAERPWILPGGILLLFGGLVGLGYMMGRR